MRFEIIKRLYLKYSSVLDHGQALLLLSVRLYWGWQFAQTGWGKLTHIDKITEYFQSLGVPMAHANAYMVGTLEFTGGILLILGIASRVITLPLTINMLVAYHFGDPEALHAIFSEPGKFYGADPYTFLFASLLVLLFGAGVFSVDQLIGLAVRAKTQDARRAPLSVASRNETA